MVLQRFDPFAEIRRAERAFNRAWNGGRSAFYDSDSWAIPLDVAHEGDDVVVTASVPGINPEDISVTIEDGLLTIDGETTAESEEKKGDYLLRERRVGKFHRSLRLPSTVDAEKAEPSYENGVLTVTLPKLEAKKAKRLEIKAG